VGLYAFDTSISQCQLPREGLTELACLVRVFLWTACRVMAIHSPDLWTKPHSPQTGLLLDEGSRLVRCRGPPVARQVSRRDQDRLFGYLSFCSMVTYGGREFLHGVVRLRVRPDGAAWAGHERCISIGLCGRTCRISRAPRSAAWIGGSPWRPRGRARPGAGLP